MHHRVIAQITTYPCIGNGPNTVYQLPVTKQNRFLSINIDEKQGLNKHHESRFIIAAIKTLIIGQLPDSQPVFMKHISD